MQKKHFFLEIFCKFCFFSILGAGKDATSLFDEYHAWVNIDQLLSKCYVGPLRNTAVLNLKDSSSITDLRAMLSPPSIGILKFPSLLSASSEGLNKVTSDTKSSSQANSTEVIPRFDWIQKTSELSVYFYTKNFCNPGLLIERLSDQEIEIKILIAATSNTYKFSFLKSVNWPCSVKINQETGELLKQEFQFYVNCVLVGKIEITFKKLNAELWSNFGIFERRRIKDESLYSQYSIVSKCNFNKDSFEMILRPVKLQIILVPIGFHLNIKQTLPGKLSFFSVT